MIKSFFYVSPHCTHEQAKEAGMFNPNTTPTNKKATAKPKRRRTKEKKKYKKYKKRSQKEEL